MLVLDTDHLSELEVRSPAGTRLLARLEQAHDDAFITAVTCEEQLRGWLVEIKRHAKPRSQITAYARLIRTVESHARWPILLLDEESVAEYEALEKKRVRIGTNDLKIAAISLAHDATLLTRNVVDFGKVPGLKFENWLE
ncbi:type II toxin-antitoxin system VapC family toxin [Prosthecobacter sp.]|uniref:type II toxin-antitoxin system VapC family toxin n=1 Tax=Prosthecobacter sp. TaxID=1965333 RepID=UPI002ABBB778|nr:type II toxin-antitoxin system VapC family toxin [Prosthecobacter sp.]MDZ4405971.1 type II toxin-antitoxin system VapC family toxin [Prosthecobacter sp.]